MVSSFSLSVLSVHLSSWRSRRTSSPCAVCNSTSPRDRSSSWTCAKRYAVVFCVFGFVVVLFDDDVLFSLELEMLIYIT